MYTCPKDLSLLQRIIAFQNARKVVGLALYFVGPYLFISETASHLFKILHQMAFHFIPELFGCSALQNV